MVRARSQTAGMDDQRLGTVIRLVRQRRHWRQADLAARAKVSAPFVSRLERGHVGPQTLDRIRAVAAALEIRVDLVPRWRAGDLDRLLNARHSALHEAVARWIRSRYPAWVLAPEVTFAIYADRGVIDILAWHPGRRAVLVIELKTEIVDVNELLATLDKKRRVARQIATARGWDALTVSAWLIVVDSRTSRRRIEAHTAMLKGALPEGAAAMRAWLRDPTAPVAGMSFWKERAENPRPSGIRRVRATQVPVPARATPSRDTNLKGLDGTAGC
jgi:transcriptional regulator with XRE-family HTH domain